MAERGLLEPLIITEDGDVSEGLPETDAVSRLAVIVQSNNGESALKKEEGPICEGKNEEDPDSKMSLREQSPAEKKQQAMMEKDLGGEFALDKEDTADESEETEAINDELSRVDSESEGQINVEMKIEANPEKSKDTEKETVTPTALQVDINGHNSSDKPLEGMQGQQEDQETAHQLTPDFPESLYELLCTLQEGRRFNDQRCSFRLESGMRRRRCHSEPSTTKPANRVIFSSMTSLQREEFFELVATAQARRLDDQRALLEKSPPKPKARGFRGSLKQLSLVRKPAPILVPKEDLYNMILSTQAQGRLEDQRSRAPGPMDDEDFFSLLLKVQGGRMEEQRTEFPHMLQT